MTQFWWVHPHSRGENLVNPPRLVQNEGSSPLARGKYSQVHQNYGRTRFIPTRAGKIGGDEGGDLNFRVHPHSRGENNRVKVFHVFVEGSSPLARGKLSKPPLKTFSVGFIPTRAGKIKVGEKIGSTLGVHPHSRGENRVRWALEYPQDGSSPLARGKLPERSLDHTPGGFIPTRAGKMRQRCWNSSLR